MAKFEQLLSQDPIGAFDKIKSNLKRYFETQYSFKGDDLNELNNERCRLLSENDNLYKEPYIEILPEYETYEKDQDALIEEFEDAFGSKEKSKSFFEFINKGLMTYGVHNAYKHQLEMLKRAFSEGNNTVITSGTGSGKTEAFLLPLFAQIYKEAQNWGSLNPSYNSQWPNLNEPYEPSQRNGEKRPAAIRALVLYPMNALVSDQMARMRKALDSDDVRKWMDDNIQGNRIFFGGYNGETIGKSNYDLIPNDKKRDACKNVTEKLEKLGSTYKSILKFVENNTDKEDALYTSPRITEGSFTSEMVTRWDMQQTPPDILITNVSMLSIMLMRKAEREMFEKTKEWLAESKDNVFHLIVDELHMYRDTAGSEVACLVRMLFNALGLKPVINGKPNSQIRILASSASLGSEDETNKFLEEFFGIYSTETETKAFVQQHGSDFKPEIDGDLQLDYSVFGYFYQNDFIVKNDEEKRIMLDKWAEDHFDASISEFIKKYDTKIFDDIKSLLSRPKSINDLYGEGKLFKTIEELRGFLIFRGYIDKITKDHRLPRFRFHQFFKYIEGLWGELKNNETPIANLSYTSQEIGPNGNKMLELLRCETCGSLFIGGNKKMVGAEEYLTLNYPDLNKIPTFNPTPMVQNKTWDEYMIFWPSNKDAVNLDNDENLIATIDGSNTNQDSNLPKRDNGKASWVKKYLKPSTGELVGAQSNNSYIEGFLYTITPNKKHPIPNKASALPCTCPKCKQNFAGRLYTKSPIRSFRSGIERNNQLLSKELIYQLSENSRKLIGFTDSRGDAADLSKGIAKEHYRDMLRMAFVECVQDKEVNQETIDRIEKFVAQRRENGDEWRDMSNDVIRNFGKHTEKIGEGIYNKLRGRAISLDSFIEQAKYIPLNDFIGQNLDGLIVQKLLKLGINPAGEEFRFQTAENNINHWSTMYDFTNLRVNIQSNDNHKGKIRTEIVSSIFANTFGKYMGVSTTDSGIGYICCPRDKDISILRPYFNGKSDEEIYDFIDAYIRVLGDNYRYRTNNEENLTQYTQYTNTTPPKKYKEPIKRICPDNHDGTNNLGTALITFFTTTQIAPGLILQFENLAFKMMDKYIECPNCHRIHPNKGFGFCSNSFCQEELDDNNKKDAQELRNRHFISYDIMVENRKPIRLHTEELTGQTDNMQERLLEFKDIITLENTTQTVYLEGYNKTKPIDMVCVTTTMEAGVDIGSLEAIFQGNMPPTRYNYQQRVGRAGRRGQAYSAAVTFCRGRSHDSYYYHSATDEITGATPNPPKLALAPYDDNGTWCMKNAIMKRVIVKELLKEAFKDLEYNHDLKDNAGEFGTISDWENGTTKGILVDWLQDNDNIIIETIDRYYSQFNKDEIIKDDVDAIYDWINDCLVKDIDSIVPQASSPSSGLAQHLAESGLLPLYGLPSDVREFYHGVKQDHNNNYTLQSIDRSSQMAITEFAPYSIKVKDKGSFMVEGLTTPIYLRDSDHALCFYDRNGDALAHRYNMVIDQENDIKSITKNEDSLNNNGQYKNLIIPQAYRASIIKGNQGQAENNDKKSSYCQTIIWADDNKQNISRGCGNVKISVYGLGNSDNPEVWHINNYNGRYYKGSYGGENLNPHSHYGNFMIDAENGRYEIALGSKKSTDMIKLELLNCNDRLNLDTRTGNKSAIRAAFYSAAFLLQRVLADKLDVQPNEIEISEKIGENGVPVIYLHDALPNGAGIVSYLYHGLDDLLKEICDTTEDGGNKFIQHLLKHRKNCVTACQHCLLSYDNRGFHHVLDWRMGLGILQLMKNPEYDFGLDGNREKELMDLDSLIELAESRIPRNLFANQPSVVHPLWRKNGKNLFKILRSDLSEDNVNHPQENNFDSSDASSDISLVMR